MPRIKMTNSLVNPVKVSDMVLGMFMSQLGKACSEALGMFMLEAVGHVYAHFFSLS